MYIHRRRGSGQPTSCTWCSREVIRYNIQRHLLQECPSAPKPSENQRFCSCCERLMEIAQFNKNIRRKSGYDSTCKECSVQRLGKWKEKHAGEDRSNVEIVRRPRAWRLRPCEWCGEKFGARDYLLHIPRCPKRPERKHGRPTRPIEILGNQVAMKREAESPGYQDRARRESHLKWVFKIGVEEYARMEMEQHGRCAICGNAPPLIGKKTRILYVDHDHRTGEVRRLLCHHCNVGLGHFDDDPALLLKALDYLTRHSKPKLVS